MYLFRSWTLCEAFVNPLLIVFKFPRWINNLKLLYAEDIMVDQNSILSETELTVRMKNLTWLFLPYCCVNIWPLNSKSCQFSFLLVPCGPQCDDTPAFICYCMGQHADTHNEESHPWCCSLAIQLWETHYNILIYLANIHALFLMALFVCLNPLPSLALTSSKFDEQNFLQALMWVGVSDPPWR